MDVRTEILQVSLKLFNEFGSENISTNEIAKKTDISTGTLYYYFKNKEEIVFTIWDIITQQHEESFQKRTTENMSAKEKILEYFNFNECQEEFDKEQILILFQHFVSSMLIDKTKLYTAYFESFFQKDYNFISTCLNEGIKKGEFIIDDVDMLTNNIIMLLKGLLVKSKASNMNFDETQKILSKHVIYLLEQCTRKKQ